MQKDLKYFYLENGVDFIMEENLQNRTIKPQENSHVNTQSAIQPKVENASSNVHVASSCKTLDELYNAINNFKECALKETAINTVIYDGDKNSDIVFIGEAPGRHEDERGIPFCGQSGKLLDQIILALGHERKNVYITNTVFWRPPGNRRPTPEELEMCRPFVQKHIALLKPKILVLVGATAVESLLGEQLPMKQVRQKVMQYTNEYIEGEIKMFAIFHPSYLLRQPLKKKDMWADMQFILKNLQNSESAAQEISTTAITA